MSFPFLVVEPPALIDSVSPPPRTDSSLDTEVFTADISLKVREAEAPIPIAIEPPPEEISPIVPETPTSLPELPPNDKSAADLGAPLSVQNTNTRKPPIVNPPKEETEVVIGLAANNIGEETIIAARKRGDTISRQYRMGSDNPIVQSSNPSKEVPLELISDVQEYDQNGRIITARGNVTLRFANSVLTADRLQINLPEKLAVAEGKVILTRGDQILRGDRFEYYFVQDSGVVFNANGELYQPSTGRDFASGLPTDVSAGTSSFEPLSDRLAINQPLQRITTGEGFQFVIGGQNPANRDRQSGGQSRGTINRLRFEADRLDFDGKIWNATNIRLTNDPFSPPEIEVRATNANFRGTGPFTSELNMTNSQVVFDQRVNAPTFIDRLVFDSRRRRPTLINPGYDGEDRGGFFIESTFPVVETPTVRFELTPQYLIQKVLSPDSFPTANPGGGEVGAFSPKAFGLLGNLEVNASERTFIKATASFSSLDLEQLENSVRSKIRVEQKIGEIENPYFLNVEYNYRERLFNGSLGFQTVNSSIGALLISPVILLPYDIRLSYQASIQNVDAPTDRTSLLPPDYTSNVTNLTRLQGAASLNKSFLLWAGSTLPPTPDEGLKYTPVPVQPFVAFVTGLTGVTSYYSNGETQNSLTATVGILGQFGQFSRSFLDYTGFNFNFSQGLVNGQSPFFFDRFVDEQTISYGITQQIYGPVRVGFQSVYSLTQSREISTEYFIEWSRRTYSLVLRYNPTLQLGVINIRVSDFNWAGNPGYFNNDVRPVVGGVTR